MTRSFVVGVLASSAISVAVTLGAVALVLPAGSHAAPDDQVTPMVRTRGLELVDERGVMRGALKVVEGSAVFALSDQDGIQTLGMTVDRNDAEFVMGHSNEGYAHAKIVLVRGGQPTFFVRDDQGAGAAIGVADDGTVGYVAVDRAGQMRSAMGIGADGSPTIGLMGPTGQMLWSAP